MDEHDGQLIVYRYKDMKTSTPFHLHIERYIAILRQKIRDTNLITRVFIKRKISESCCYETVKQEMFVK